MTYMKKLLLPCTVLLSGVLLLSCGRTKGNNPLEAPRGVEKTGDLEKVSLGQQDGSVRIIPENPRVNSDLLAVFSGSAKVMDYIWFRNGAPIEGVNGEGLAKGNFKKGDEIRVTVNADGVKRSFSVVIGNSPPAVTGVKLNPEYIHRGVDITAEAEGSDPDGDSVTFDYQWIINGEELPALTGPVLKGDQFKRGDRVAVRVAPYDSYISGVPFTTPPVVIPDAPPAFVSTPPKEFASRTYIYKVQAVDLDGDTINFSLSKAPKGMKIGNDGTIEWAVTNEDKGSHEVSITADDGQGGTATQEYKIDISIK